jgi:hypothetical protein
MIIRDLPLRIFQYLSCAAEIKSKKSENALTAKGVLILD